MSPANIENRIKAACPLVGSVVAIGDRRPFNAALRRARPRRRGGVRRRARGSDPRRRSSPATRACSAAVQAGIEQANAALAASSRSSGTRSCRSEWQPGGDELTPTMKLKRRPIAEKYAAEIEAMYAA